MELWFSNHRHEDFQSSALLTIASLFGQRVKFKDLITSLIAILRMNLRIFQKISSVRFGSIAVSQSIARQNPLNVCSTPVSGRPRVIHNASDRHVTGTQRHLNVIQWSPCKFRVSKPHFSDPTHPVPPVFSECGPCLYTYYFGHPKSNLYS
jgi:hypothetical protein